MRASRVPQQRGRGTGFSGLRAGAPISAGPAGGTELCRGLGSQPLDAQKPHA